MSDPFLGEIRAFPYSFAPTGWLPCNGQILPIAPNKALFSLLGTQYGGDGQTTFGLPDLRGRALVAAGTGPDGIAYQQAKAGGAETVVLTAATVPAHTHEWTATSATANTFSPIGNYPAAATARPAPPAPPPAPPPPPPPSYATFAPPSGNVVALASTTLANAGADEAHPNMQPYLVLGYFIAVQGIYPSRY